MKHDFRRKESAAIVKVKEKTNRRQSYKTQVIFSLEEAHTLMEYEQLCKKILDMDKQIRFVAVYNSNIEKIAGGMREGTKTLIPESITKLSVEQSFIRRDSRIKMQEWIGLPKYALAEYDKIKRFTFYLKNDHLLLVSTELTLDSNSFVTEVSKLI